MLEMMVAIEVVEVMQAMVVVRWRTGLVGNGA